MGRPIYIATDHISHHMLPIHTTHTHTHIHLRLQCGCLPLSVSGRTSSSPPSLLFRHQDLTTAPGGQTRSILVQGGRTWEHASVATLTACCAENTLEFSGWTFLVFTSGSVVTILLHHSIRLIYKTEHT